jgi:hypothetical protein
VTVENGYGPGMTPRSLVGSKAAGEGVPRSSLEAGDSDSRGRSPCKERLLPWPYDIAGPLLQDPSRSLMHSTTTSHGAEHATDTPPH